MATSKKAGAELFIGTSGYSYPDWKGIVYPRSVKRDVQLDELLSSSRDAVSLISEEFHVLPVNKEST